MNNAALITPDRYLFLCALQNAAPAFWAGLKESIDNGTSVERWAENVGVVDDWLIEVLRATVRRWREHPEHPGCRLAEGWEWFTYPSSNPVEPFAPTFSDPYPRFSGILSDPETNTARSLDQTKAIRNTWRFETPAEFAGRMKRQFNSALTNHKRYLRPLLSKRTRQRMEHAEWTALVIFGLKADNSPITIVEIAERWTTLEHSQDSYATVYRAVRRFASGIGLTFPKKTLNKTLY